LAVHGFVVRGALQLFVLEGEGDYEVGVPRSVVCAVADVRAQLHRERLQNQAGDPLVRIVGVFSSYQSRAVNHGLESRSQDAPNSTPQVLGLSPACIEKPF